MKLKNQEERREYAEKDHHSHDPECSTLIPAAIGWDSDMSVELSFD